MVMSTKEQETFETALVTPASLASIKAGLSKIDVRQVRTPPWLLLRALRVPYQHNHTTAALMIPPPRALSLSSL